MHSMEQHLSGFVRIGLAAALRKIIALVHYSTSTGLELRVLGVLQWLLVSKRPHIYPNNLSNC